MSGGAIRGCSGAGLGVPVVPPQGQVEKDCAIIFEVRNELSAKEGPWQSQPVRH